MKAIPRGRKRKFSEYEELLQSLPKVMTKRPKYVNGIGVFRGAKGDTAWIKISLPNGAAHNGKSYAKGSSLEIKVGYLSSWSWQQLEDKHRELQGKADRGEPLEDQVSILFKDWADDWLRNAEGRLKSFPTVYIHVKNQLSPRFGRMKLEDVSVSKINDWITDRLKTAAPATAKRELATLGVMLNDAVKSELLSSNPVRKANVIKGIKARQRFLDTEEMIRLLDKAEKEADWLYDLILWQLHSGMRKSETLGLTWQDIRELPNGNIIAELNDTKSGIGRQVTCTKTMKDIISRQRTRRKADDDRFFPYASITIRRKWQKVRQLADLSDVVLHDLRRTHATHAMTAGVDPRTLAGRIGHTDLTMLQKHYAALVGSAADEAAEKIEASLKIVE